jgi:hypothetical protein
MGLWRGNAALWQFLPVDCGIRDRSTTAHQLLYEEPSA